MLHAYHRADSHWVLKHSLMYSLMMFARFGYISVVHDVLPDDAIPTFINYVKREIPTLHLLDKTVRSQIPFQWAVSLTRRNLDYTQVVASSLEMVQLRQVQQSRVSLVSRQRAQSDAQQCLMLVESVQSQLDSNSNQGSNSPLDIIVSQLRQRISLLAAEHTASL
jgi:hypothetical protein